MCPQPIIQFRRVSKVYHKGGADIHPLDEITLTIQEGDFVALMGPSGSGKTTLLNLLGGLDTPTSGEVIVCGQDLAALSSHERARWRCDHVAYVFQAYNLLPVLTGQAPNDLDERTLVWRKEDYKAIRHGRWKLQTSRYPEKVWLHDLATDPTERHNLAEAMPDKVRELQALLAEQEKGFAPPGWTPTGRSRIDIDGHSPHEAEDVEHVYWAN